MHLSERTLLLDGANNTNYTFRNNNLSVTFAIVCIVDVFGVFPVVTLPKVIIDCGFYGIVVIIIVCSLQIYTAVLLGRCWIMAEELDSRIERKNRYPYSALAEITYGSTLANFVSFLLDITIFGGGIPNLIVASQNLHFLGLQISNNAVDISFCYWIIALGMILCPILWLGSPKNMKLLSSISVFMVILVFVFILECLIFSPTGSYSDFNQVNTQDSLWQSMLTSYGIITFQYDIHPTILTIHVDMKEKTKLVTAIFGGFIAFPEVSLGMVAATTTITAIKFGLSTKPSILETLPVTIPLHLVVLFVALQLCLSSAVSNNALYQHMEDCMEIERAFNHRRCILRTTLTLLAALIAISVPKFDLVMSLIGGTLTAPLAFIFPPLFYLKMLRLRKKHKKELALETFTKSIYNSIEEKSNSGKNQIWHHFTSKSNHRENFEVLTCLMIIISNLVLTIFATYVNVKNVVHYANFSQPCILNVSSAIINL